MTDSVLPQFGSWWRSAGERIGAGAKIPPGASSTPYDNEAQPVGDRVWDVVMEYISDADSSVTVRTNGFNAANQGMGDVGVPTTVWMPFAPAPRVETVTVRLPTRITEKWLPSIKVTESGTAVQFLTVNVYEHVPEPGAEMQLWDGVLPATGEVTVWDGSREIPTVLDVKIN